MKLLPDSSSLNLLGFFVISSLKFPQMYFEYGRMRKLVY